MQMTPISLDIGHSAIKIAAGPKKNALFVAAATPRTDAATVGRASLAPHDAVTVNGQEWLVGDAAIIHAGGRVPDGLADNWLETDQHHALLAGAFRRATGMAELTPSEALVILGLPSRLYDKQHKRLAELAQLHLNLRSDQVMVLPQAFGGYMADALDADGAPNVNESPAEGRFGVIDVGYYTTDFALMDRGQWSPVGAKSADGTYAMAAALQGVIERNHGASIPVRECDTIMSTRSGKLRGALIDFGKEVDATIDSYTGRLIDHIETVYADTLNVMDGLILVGGGANLVGSRLRSAYPNLLRAPRGIDSRFAVAEGLRRYGLFDLSMREQPATATTAEEAGE